MESILNRNSIVWQFGETKVSTRGRPTSVVSRTDCCAVAAASLVYANLREPLDNIRFKLVFVPPMGSCDLKLSKRIHNVFLTVSHF